MDARELRMRLSGSTPRVAARPSPTSEVRLQEITREESQRFLARFGLSQRAEESLRQILSSLPRIEVSGAQGELLKTTAAGVLTRRDTDNPERLAERLRRAPTISIPTVPVSGESERLAVVLSQLLERTISLTAAQLSDAHLQFDARAAERLKQAIQQLGREYPAETLLRVVLLIEQRIEGGTEVDEKFREFVRQLRLALEGFIQSRTDGSAVEQYLTNFQDTLIDAFPSPALPTLTERNQRLLAVLERQVAITIASIERQPLTPDALPSIRERLMSVIEPLRAEAVYTSLPSTLRQVLQGVSQLLLPEIDQERAARELPAMLRELGQVIRTIGRELPIDGVGREIRAERGSLHSFEQSLLQSIREALQAVVKIELGGRSDAPEQRGRIASSTSGTPVADRAVPIPTGDSIPPQAEDGAALARSSGERARVEEVARRAPEQTRRLSDLIERMRIPEGSDQITGQATRFIEQTVAAQQQLAQVAPLLRASGEPALLLFPGLFQGLLSRIEIVDYGTRALDHSSDLGSNAASSEEQESFTIRLELPKLGVILAIVSYTPRQLSLTLESSSEHVRQFLRKSSGTLRFLGQRLGFVEVVVSVEPPRQRTRLPSWVARLGTPPVL